MSDRVLTPTEMQSTNAVLDHERGRLDLSGYVEDHAAEWGRDEEKEEHREFLAEPANQETIHRIFSEWQKGKKAAGTL